MRLARRLSLLLALFACLAATAVEAAGSVALVLSEPSQAYQEFAEALRAELRRDAGVDVQVYDGEQLGSKPLPEVQLVIAVGSRAAQQMAARDMRTPLLLSLLPKTSFDRIIASRPPAEARRISAVFVDQPPARYVDLLRVAVPDQEKLGLLAGRDSRDSVARLVQVARERKLKAQQEIVNTEFDIVPALQRMFTDGGVLLATPDGSVFNSSTIPNILLSAYRMRVAVVGFSQSYVKAGAMLALYSTPGQLGTQSGDIARSVLGGGALPAPQYPRQFLVGVNTHVARSLGYQLDSEANIKEKLERLERTP